MAKTNVIETPAINMIGKGTSIKGDISSNGDFRIDGSLTGTIKSDGKIVVGVTGSIDGEVVCQNADISGSVNASIEVTELLSLKSTSVVKGDIVTDKLAIEPGAKFSGTCSMDLKRPGQAKAKAQYEPVQETEKVTG